MGNTGDYVHTEGNTKTTITYSCTPKDMQYTIIGEEIKKDFDFLIKNIPNLLDESLNDLNAAAGTTNAFYVEGSSKYNDLMHVYEELKQDVAKVKQNLSTIHGRLMTTIDNVNAELENNFGHWAFFSVNEAGRKVETVDISSSSSGSN